MYGRQHQHLQLLRLRVLHSFRWRARARAAAPAGAPLRPSAPRERPRRSNREPTPSSQISSDLQSKIAPRLELPQKEKGVLTAGRHELRISQKLYCRRTRSGHSRASTADLLGRPARYAAARCDPAQPTRGEGQRYRVEGGVGGPNVWQTHHYSSAGDDNASKHHQQRASSADGWPCS